MTGRFKCLNQACCASLLGLALLAGPAVAADMAGPMDTVEAGATMATLSGLGNAGPIADEAGNLGLAASLDWAEPLADEEMGELRGGIGGVSFSLYYAGFIENLGSSVGNIAINSPDIDIMPAGSDLSDLVGDTAGGQIFFENLAGSFQGFNGVAQSLNVIGNNNQVQQTMLINLNVINVADPSKLRIDSLSTLLGM